MTKEDALNTILPTASRCRSDGINRGINLLEKQKELHPDALFFFQAHLSATNARLDEAVESISSLSRLFNDLLKRVRCLECMVIENYDYSDED